MSLASLRLLSPPAPISMFPGSRWGLIREYGLEDIITDLEWFARDLGTMKVASDQFLEQQVSKISLQEARMSIREARDLKRLSYLAFVFVPLSLVSSWFGMNLEPLDGSTPLWVFIVTSLGILAFSTCVVWLTTSTTARKGWERLKSVVFAGAAEAWAKDQEAPFKPALLQTPTMLVDHPSAVGSVSGRPEPSLGFLHPSPNVSANSGVIDPNTTNVASQTAITSPTAPQKAPFNSWIPAPMEKHRKKVPMNDHLRRINEKQLLDPTPQSLTLFHRTLHRDPPSSSCNTPQIQKSLQYPAQHRPAKRNVPATNTAGSSTEVTEALDPVPDMSEGSRHQKSTSDNAPVTVNPEQEKGEAAPTKQPLNDAVAQPGRGPLSLYQAACSGDTDLIRQILRGDPGAAPDSASTEALVRGALELSFRDRLPPYPAAASERLIQATKLDGRNYDNTYTWALGKLLTAPLARTTDRNVIQSLVGGITDPAQRKSASSSALRHATEDPTLTAYLLDAGADADSGWPLRLACRNGCEEVVRLLLAAGADPNGSDDGRGPLSEVRGNLYLLRLLVEAGADVNGFMAVWMAARLGSVPSLRLLVDAGANVNVEQTSGYALGVERPSEPLIEACAWGHVGAVRFLLAAGVDLDYVLEDGKTKGEQALETACSSGREAIALLLMDAGVIKPPQTQPGVFTKAMGYAVTHGALAVMARFLESGSVDSNGLTEDKHCFLVEAAERGHAEAAALLLAHGAQVDGVGGTIPLHAAALLGHVGVARALLDRGADVMAKSSDGGKTALHFAASADLPFGFYSGGGGAKEGDVTHLLLARGAEIDAQSNDGLTPLQVAAREGALGPTQALLEAGADFKVRDNEGWTPAHRVAWNQHREVVVALMMVGADLSLETDEGLTVIDLLEASEEDDVSLP